MYNPIHAAEREERRDALAALTEMDRVAMCEYPIRPCNCGTCDMGDEL